MAKPFELLVVLTRSPSSEVLHNHIIASIAAAGGYLWHLPRRRPERSSDDGGVEANAVSATAHSLIDQAGCLTPPVRAHEP